MWDLDSPSAQAGQQDRHNALKQKYWKDMISGGSIAMQHDGSFYSARRIIYYLIDKPKILLYHQHERGNEKKSFWQTEAGTKARSDRELNDPTMGDFGKSEPGPGLWDTSSALWQRWPALWKRLPEVRAGGKDDATSQFVLGQRAKLKVSPEL
ncbi:hypothetical protein NW754_004717 [Fusarium falciforme]|nr:hypothetical protein NW754_004717 [Fusarium falciforme]